MSALIAVQVYVVCAKALSSWYVNWVFPWIVNYDQEVFVLRDYIRPQINSDGKQHGV